MRKKELIEKNNILLEQKMLLEKIGVEGLVNDLTLKIDMLTKKVNSLDIQPNGDASDILIRNAKALKKLARKEGISIRELFKMISRE